MQITKLNKPFPFPQDIEREAGVHLSDILDIIYPFEGETTDETKRKFELAFALEAALERGLAERQVSRPPQMSQDGIWLSPDGIEIINAGYSYESDGELVTIPDELRLLEYKLTWKSIKNFDLYKAERYLCQVKSYCWALQTKECEMWVFYVNGDYKWSQSETGWPYFECYLLEFSEKELNDNWAMILNTARAHNLIEEESHE